MSGLIISQHEIIGRLAAEVSCSPEVVGAFLREFSAIAGEGLATDGVVEIDGLGTFRVVADMAGNPTVEFAPAASLAGKVNEPFAMFESVELADSITDADLESEGKNDEPVEESPLEISSEEPAEKIPEPAAEILPPPLPARFARKENITVNVSPDEVCASELQEPPSQERPVLEPRVPQDSQAEEHTTEEEPIGVPDSNPLAVRLEPESSVTIQRVGHTTLTLVVTAIAACLLGLILGYLSYKWLNNTLPADVEILEDGILIRHESGIVEEEIIPFEDSMTDSVETDMAADQDTVESMAEETAQSSEKVAPTSSQAVVTDTVGPGNYLTVMARRHYGNAKFWVYIYLENKDKIRNPDNLENGMVLVIPPAEKYGIDPSNPESLKKAEKEAYKVMPG